MVIYGVVLIQKSTSCAVKVAESMNIQVIKADPKKALDMPALLQQVSHVSYRTLLSYH
jgi:hypothetical protein